MPDEEDGDEEEEEDDEYDEDDTQSSSSEEDEEDEQRSPSGSWQHAATLKKHVWSRKRVWMVRMRRLLGGKFSVAEFTMKRYLFALCAKLQVRVKTNATAKQMGQLLDGRLAGGGNQAATERPAAASDKKGDKKMRWSDPRRRTARACLP